MTFTFFKTDDGVQHRIKTNALPPIFANHCGKTIHADFDGENLRHVLAYYRNQHRSVYQDDEQFTLDLQRFEQLLELTECTVAVGGQIFHSTKETLSKLPVLEASFRANLPVADDFDFDPQSFGKILSWLRHPVQHTVDAELQNDLDFWGIYLDDVVRFGNDNFSHSALNVAERPNKFNQNQPFNSVGRLLRQNPQENPFVHRFNRQTGFQSDLIRLENPNSDPFQKKYNVFDLTGGNCDYLGQLYLVLESNAAIDNLTEFLQSVSVRCGDVLVKHSSQFLATLLLQKNCQISCHRTDSLQYITCIPLQFWFCQDIKFALSLYYPGAYPFTVTVECVEGCNSTQLHILAEVYQVDADVRENLVEKVFEEKIITAPITVFENSKPKNKLLQIHKSFEQPLTVESFYIVVTDLKTKEIVQATCTGTIRFDNYNFIVNPVTNQIAQLRYKKASNRFITGYDSRIWFHSFALCAPHNLQPSGFQTCSRVEINLQIDTNHTDVAVDLVFQVYKISHWNKTDSMTQLRIIGEIPGYLASN